MSKVASDHIRDLLSWAKHSGSQFHSEVEVYHDSLTGLSFRAVDDILKGTHLVDCAYETTLSYLNAIQASAQFSLHEAEPFPATFLNTLFQDDANVIGYFFLIQQLVKAFFGQYLLTECRYLLKEESFWWKYIRLLPQPDEPERLAVPVLWPEDDQRFLDGTNAEPAIKKRRELWEAEWITAVGLLKSEFDGWDCYTFPLYQWAAAIFGSRSFRPSLTISPDVFSSSTSSRKDSLIQNITHDSFSILLPVLDIGNHNGCDQVDWSYSPTSFSLLNKDIIPKGSQIYNFYGSKSNSELLVAYGFLLPQSENDRVNLKVNPPPEIQRLRRSQVSHVMPREQQKDEEFLFGVGVNPRQPTVSLSYFSRGLFDTTVCMVANAREHKWISKNIDYSPERDVSVFKGPLARAGLQALVVLKAKLTSELARLQKTRPESAQNHNQHLALEYRQRQEHVLNTALPLISRQIDSRALTSLGTAFTWLRLHYPTLSTDVESFIADDQEETLPLDWLVLAEDWDYTYLTVWIYLILSLKQSDPTGFKQRHTSLNLWLLDMQESGANSDDQLFAETSEIDTINLTIGFVADKLGHAALWRNRMRNLASWIVKEEAIRGVQAQGDASEDAIILQIMLSIEL